MDDNEAEVDLAVSASILLANAGEPGQPNGNANEENVDANLQSTTVEDNNANGENLEEGMDTIIGDIEDDPAGNEKAKGDDGVTEITDTEEGHLVEDAESKENVPADETSTTESEETVERITDVISVVSRDHISPSPANLSANVVNAVDSSTTQTDIEHPETLPNLSEETITTTEENTEEIIENTSTPQNASSSERSWSDSHGKVITVPCKPDSGEKNINVKIVDATYKKPFLGGFRHKHTGVEYLNASSQTYPKKRIPKNVEVYSRDTQTVEKKSQMQQTTYDTSTQMTKSGCYVSDIGDVIRVPGKYVTAAEKEEIKLEKVIIIQSYWRRWLASQYVKKLKIDRDLRIEWELKESKRIAAERVERLRQEFERRMKPKTKADFDLLYAALERWRQEEMDRINNSHSGPERKAALIALLEQEAYLIQSIERHKLNADESNYTDNVVKFLDKAAQPKFWRAYDGRKTEMNTRYSLRAQELRDLYNSLQMKYLNPDERLDVLLTLKHTVKEHDCKLTQEIIELIDREADLLTRNVKSSNLEGLRQRISTLFLQYCKTPSFNPDVARLLKVPSEPSTLRKDVYFCPSCNSYLPSSEFPLASNSRIVGRCKKMFKIRQ